MDKKEICPKCAARFSGRKRLQSWGQRVGYNAFSEGGLPVRCPNCWNEFPARNLRLFGFLPTTSLPWVVGAILAACVILSFVKRHAG